MIFRTRLVLLIDHSCYVVTSRRITNAEESITERTNNDHLANMKVFCVMTLRPFGWLIFLTGKDQQENVAFIPNRIVALYALAGQNFCGSK